ncbi:hypothetical protein FA95DRAFT_1611715 [Auriscalpium vulgare]|uniref:Uncharacterized protein n=1 Tax=Auriscalpium vulgare TaxID=40419 RepID=A0ACB8R954_9AGAM|nr:hypothetical protein FA95DRAFT_1611715 [Auriscalpium vulgare]
MPISSSVLDGGAEKDGGKIWQRTLVQRNVSHVARLPAEIVTGIFLTTRVLERAEKEDRWERDNPVADKLGWIQLTHVCRHWRQLALGFHSLWAEIDFARKEFWVAELFHRAGPSALLSIYVSRPPTPSQSRLVQDSLPRIKYLRIECWSAIQPYLSLVDSLKNSAPHLETFEFHDHNTELGNFLYPNGLFGNTTPQLRRFVADSVGAAPWTLPHLCNLTSLSIWLHQGHAGPEVQMEDILSALERMPALQELDLWEGPAGASPTSIWVRNHAAANGHIGITF